MLSEHFKFWPKRLPKSLSIPKTTVVDNLEVAARRYPKKTAIIYYGGEMSYQQLQSEVETVAAYLQTIGVSKGDRVILYMQNSPQYVISYYAILRANAVVVPINPMNKKEELEFYCNDCQAKVAIVGQELYDQIAELRESTELSHLIIASYSEYISDSFDPSYEYPKEVTMPPMFQSSSNCETTWKEVLLYQGQVGPIETSASDLAVLPYTSGTTGKPKGCIHTHQTIQANVVSAFCWMNHTSDSVSLTTLPLFHVTGMQHSMNAPIYGGGTMVIMTRWDRELAAKWIEDYQCTNWINISTMLVDFLSNPNIDDLDLQSLTTIGGGGAPLPEAVGKQLYERTGIKYAEGYGLTETMSHTHFNPPDHPKLQCMGVPSFDVDARIIHTETLKEVGINTPGELVVHGPQVFNGYWNRSADNESAFIEMDGKSFFRTGDICRVDEEGYFFIVDRLKRMINVSGFKVWPTEVESILYEHPSVNQACVVGVPDQRSGEAVKAFIILNNGDQVSAEEVISWAKGQMAAYKTPRSIQFVKSLPMTSSGKILWRQLQDEEYKKRAGEE
ncbi:long-chain fatty acid--CoA ligase [Desertibacillus haloalkaliphilus]|uniref:long-chain fatty acid--CoA ligase n=1 Tax=Desertibacillus haloalkaliphilus TaxID=1328930 RepID=UPI001C26669C|nr:long-chain fatty acid--CoA ligase [Desertibacillus haloalkaliphilus]MBU8908047.1 long-chain fatty acid--CoA ligase [Desertibacillus haloalkaliphilus]